MESSRPLGGPHEQGADRAEEEKGAQGQIVRSTDPGPYAEKEEEAQVPGQGGRGGTRQADSLMNWSYPGFVDRLVLGFSHDPLSVFSY